VTVRNTADRGPITIMTVAFEEKLAPWLYALLAILVAAPFVADLLLPLGTAVWVVYLLAIACSYLAARPAVPLAIAAVATVLIVIGYFFAPAGVSEELARINRTLCVITAWIIATTGYLFIQNKLAIRRQEWLQLGEMGLAGEVAGDQSVEQVTDNILIFLTRYLGAASGAFFVSRDGKFERAASYGIPNDAPVPMQFTIGDGLLGQVAKDGKLIALSEVPDDYIYVGSSLGKALPRHLVMAAAVNDGVVQGVLELGYLSPAHADHSELLDRVSAAMAVALRSADYRQTLRRLLDETQQQAAELQAQSDELHASNDELAAQSQSLQLSQERLELQQAELEQNNAQLEAQTQELEAQRDDLTRTQLTLQQQARDLEQASRYKSEFLSNMSHELRTPLNSLLILSQLLAENKGGNLSAEQVKFAKTIGSSGNDLLTLINDILDISKIEAGQVEVQFQTTGIMDVIGKLKNTFEPAIEQKGLTLRIETAGDLPASIVTDSLRLEQVLKNFLSNAVKFTHAGEIGLMVERAGQTQIVFTVRDSGIGISTSQLQAIFEPFRQADGTISRKYGGTGLGLSISRELSGLLGGEIKVSSKEGEGSAFSVILPLAHDPATVAPVRTFDRQVTVSLNPATPARALEKSGAALSAPVAIPIIPDDRTMLTAGSRLLLAVEDDVHFAQILLDLAHELGLQCIIAGTADDGVSMARQYLPNAIILDIGLPDHTGLFVLDRLKHDLRTRHIPIHVVSAGDYVRKARALGAAGFTLKPVKREELAHALEGLENNLSEPVRRVLVVEDDATQLESVRLLLGSRNVSTVGAATAAECVDRLRQEAFDCMVLDLTLPDASGLDVLDHLSQDSSVAVPPVIVYTGRDLSADDELRLRKYAKSIIIKGAKSPERLLDEVTLFLHQVVSTLPDQQQEMLVKSLNRDEAVQGRRILIVEDDVRNVYALTSIFETHGALVTIARNGLEALKIIDQRLADGPSLPFDLVLMDVMMPEMDGLTATREIRNRTKLNSLPIIMLTAKAMPQDQENCLAAGANDYLAKPLDVDKLLSLVRVWMSR
jgi:signal transduction histidine kinase/CheY-like chemotaxis protein